MELRLVNFLLDEYVMLCYVIRLRLKLVIARPATGGANVAGLTLQKSIKYSETVKVNQNLSRRLCVLKNVILDDV